MKRAEAAKRIDALLELRRELRGSQRVLEIHFNELDDLRRRRSLSLNVYCLADLEPVLARFGNRGYRAAQLEGGIVGGRLYLAAYALRFGATGLTFLDEEVTEFFFPHAEGKSVMFLSAPAAPFDGAPLRGGPNC